MDDGLEVLVVAEQLRRRAPGGIGTYALGLLDGLRELGNRDALAGVRVRLHASAARGGEDLLATTGFPVTVSRLPAPVLVASWDRGLRRAPAGADVVHHVSLSGPRASVPVVSTVYDLAWRRLPAAFPARGRRWHEAALRRALRHSAHIVVPSPLTRDDLLEAGAAPDRVSVVPGAADHLAPADEAAAAGLLSRLGVRDGFLLSVGTLEPRKNLARLLEGYARARTRLSELPLVLVGPSGWGGPVAPTPGVVLAGSVAPGVLSGLYAAARLVAYVPLLEGFGLPVLEAMAAGAPVVSSPVPSAGGASRLVDPLDPESIADGLVAVAADEDCRRELRRAGLAHAAGFTWSETARAHAALWRSVARA